MKFIMPVVEPYKIGLRHGDKYPEFFRRLVHGLNTHRGVDIIAPKGRVVAAPAGGIITYAGWHWQGGKIIVINHEDGYRSWMAHFDKLLVRKGQLVIENQAVGEIDSTGISTGNHLHWHAYYNDRVIDPLLLIKDNKIMVIESLVKQMKKRLNDLLKGNKVIVENVDNGKVYIIENGVKEEFSYDAAMRRTYLTAANTKNLDEIPNKKK